MTALPARPGVVTGLLFEAEIVRQAAPGCAVICHGPGIHRAEAAARGLLGEDIDGLISFGMAGSLDPALRTGAAIVPERVADEGGAAFVCDPVWRGAILAHAPTLDGQGGLVTVSHPVTNRTSKIALREATGARAVDMESVGIAGIAQAHGLPFIALRVILDEAEDAIPMAAMAGMRSDGRTDPAATLIALMRRPQEIRALARLARANGVARKALARLAHLVL